MKYGNGMEVWYDGILVKKLFATTTCYEGIGDNECKVVIRKGEIENSRPIRKC